MVNVPLNIVQELVVEAGVIVLEIHRRALVEAVMLLDVLVGCACMFGAGFLPVKVWFGVLMSETGDNEAHNKSQVAA